ncbi:MAG: hypothetical protein PHP17_05355 [Candidatus Omnitrophica bacterium]|nr:hypothetical protein [Candidatus Omnitrophota bacterium]
MMAEAKKTPIKKTQSILEYLIVLSAIIIVIVINTIGFNTGVQNSLGLQNSLNSTQQDASSILNSPSAPNTVTREPYYTPARDITTNPNNTDAYNGPNYNGGYNYNEWVNNNPDNGNVNRTGNTITTR